MAANAGWILADVEGAEGDASGRGERSLKAEAGAVFSALPRTLPPQSVLGGWLFWIL